MADAPEPESLLPMGAGLASVEPQLIYTEAKRQYEALQRAFRGPATTRVTRQQVDLSLYYRSLWDNATRHLDGTQEIRLRHICFAYKTKTRVLQFLNLLDSEFEWAGELNVLVEECGCDSAFGQGEMTRKDSAVQITSSSTVAPTLHGVPVEENSPDVPLQADHLEPKPQQRNHFIIPTLPLALPTAYFTALGSQGAFTHLTVSNVLVQPAALLLNLSPGLKKMLRDHLPDFWKDLPDTKLRMHALQRSASRSIAVAEWQREQEEWTAFFEHLLTGRVELVSRDGKTMEGEDGGYSVVDLGIWIAGWVGVRQGGADARAKVGMGGKKRKRSTRASTAPARGDQEGSEGVPNTMDEPGVQNDQNEGNTEEEEGRSEVETGSQKRKRVRWTEQPDIVLTHRTRAKTAKDKK